MIPKLAEIDSNFEQINAQVTQLEHKVREIEDSVYASFCSKIGVDNIRQYEEFQGTLLQEASRKRLIFTTQRSRVSNQLRFEQERLAETTERLSNIDASLEKEAKLVNQLIAEKAAINEEISILQSELSAINEESSEYKEMADLKADEVAKSRGEVQRISKEIEKISKKVNAMVSTELKLVIFLEIVAE